MVDNEPMRVVSLEDLCEQLSVGKNAAYELLRSGKIKGFRIKRIWKIPQSSINSFIMSESKQ